MSRSEDQAFDEGPDEPLTTSVYDFLYHDTARVASFLAQFDPSGHLTGVEQTDTAEQTSSDKTGGSVKGGVPTLLGTSATYEGQSSTRGGEGSKRTYDPLWANARELLALLADRLVRDLRQARMGQFVIATGSLSVLDLSLFKQIWSLETVRRSAMEEVGGVSSTQNRAERRRAGKANQHRHGDADTNIDDLLKFIGAMPHLTQAVLSTSDNDQIWTTLREGSLIGSSSDLVLKHGMAVRGSWTIVGVLDATPEILPDGEVDEEVVQGQVTASQAMPGPFGDVMRELAIPLRQALGRPFTHYGVTPLMIFREVSTL